MHARPGGVNHVVGVPDSHELLQSWFGAHHEQCGGLGGAGGGRCAGGAGGGGKKRESLVAVCFIKARQHATSRMPSDRAKQHTTYPPPATDSSPFPARVQDLRVSRLSTEIRVRVKCEGLKAKRGSGVGFRVRGGDRGQDLRLLVQG